MKKHLLFIVALFAFVVAAKAQEVAPTEPKSERTRHWNIGLVIGTDRNYHIADMSYMIEYSYSKYAPGRSFGLQLGYTPVKWLTIRVDGVLTDKNVYRSHVITQSNLSLPDTTLSSYFNLPIMLQMNVGRLVQLHVFGGGYVGYLMARGRVGLTQGMDYIYYYSEMVDLESPESIRRDNRDDAGFVYGAGVSTVIVKRFEIGLEARWYYGVLDTQKDYMAHLNPHYNTTFVMQGGLSYRF